MTHMTESVVISNKQKAVVEAGELVIEKNDCIIPSKLRLLASAGWSIVDVCKDKNGGFSLLLTRKTDEE